MLVLSCLLSVADSRTLLFVGPGDCDSDDPGCKHPTPSDLKQLYTLNISHNGELFREASVEIPGSAIWLKLHPNKRALYAAIVGGSEGDTVGAIAVSPTGSLKFINQVSSCGGAPVALAMDHAANHLLVANYVGSTVAVFPIYADGAVGRNTSYVKHYGHSVNPGRQEAPHPHGIYVFPYAKQGSTEFVYVPDLGVDRIYQYKLDTNTGVLSNNTPAFITTPAGSGPRHMTFYKAKNERFFAVAITELIGSVIVYEVNTENGLLVERQRLSTLPDGFSDFNKAAELGLYPNPAQNPDVVPRYLYASNRGPATNNYAAYAIGSDGLLQFISRYDAEGSFPRHFYVHDDFLISEGQDSWTVATLNIDPDSGALSPTLHSVSLPTPVALDVLQL